MVGGDAASLIGSRHDIEKPVGEDLGVSWGDQPAGNSILDDVHDSSDRRGHHRALVTEGLEEHEEFLRQALKDIAAIEEEAVT